MLHAGLGSAGRASNHWIRFRILANGSRGLAGLAAAGALPYAAGTLTNSGRRSQFVGGRVIWKQSQKASLSGNPANTSQTVEGESDMSANRATVVISTKSPGIAILLTILFGPMFALWPASLHHASYFRWYWTRQLC